MILSLLLLSLFAQSQEILLWPEGAPGSEGKTGNDSVRVTTDGEHVVSNVHHPSITPYLPAKGKSSGSAVIVVPGGGHRELWMDHEGHNFAKWLSGRGTAAFVLKYRLAREANSTYKIEEHALADMRQAIRLVRSKAKEWEIMPSRIGAAGFSAGGELVALAGMRPDDESARLNFHALIYPGSSGKIVATKDSPPIFLACGYKDRPDISKGLAEVYLKFKEAGVPAELHIYAEAGHGFGMREKNRGAAAGWPVRFEEWLQGLQF
jgi:endo-1,4-beta-xylanase